MLTLIHDGLLNLRLFDGEASGTDGAQNATAPEIPDIKPPGPKNPLADVQYGKQEEAESQSVKTEVDREKEFEALIKGEYKDLYNKRVQGHINERFKHVKGLESRLKAHSEIADVLAMKYGVDPADTKALANAVKNDDSLFEQMADDMGLPTDVARKLAEAQQYRAAAERARREMEIQLEMFQLEQKWRQESEVIKQQYFPDFDLDAELTDPETGHQFKAMLHSGVDVKTAYIAINHDKVMPALMQHTAQKMQEKTVNDIRARGMRPVENGATSKPPATVKSRVSDFTRQDVEELARRVARGEIVKL